MKNPIQITLAHDSRSALYRVCGPFAISIHGSHHTLADDVLTSGLITSVATVPFRRLIRRYGVIVAEGEQPRLPVTVRTSSQELIDRINRLASQPTDDGTQLTKLEFLLHVKLRYFIFDFQLVPENDSEILRLTRWFQDSLQAA
jgi:hypothetical protein